MSLDTIIKEKIEKLFEKDINDLGFPNSSVAFDLFNDLYLQYFHNDKKHIIIKHNRLTFRYGQCDDCNTITLLMQSEACMCGYNCTEKYICLYDCQVKCSQGHLNYYSPNADGYVYPFQCDQCTDIIKPRFEWWGLSPNEYRKKYNE